MEDLGLTWSLCIHWNKKENGNIVHASTIQDKQYATYPPLSAINLFIIVRNNQNIIFYNNIWISEMFRSYSWGAIKDPSRTLVLSFHLCFCPNLLSPHCQNKSLFCSVLKYPAASLFDSMISFVSVFCLLLPDVILSFWFLERGSMKGDNESKKTIMAKANLDEFFWRHVESHGLNYSPHGHKAALIVCFLTLK